MKGRNRNRVGGLGEGRQITLKIGRVKEELRKRKGEKRKRRKAGGGWEEERERKRKEKRKEEGGQTYLFQFHFLPI